MTVNEQQSTSSRVVGARHNAPGTGRGHHYFMADPPEQIYRCIFFSSVLDGSASIASVTN